MFIEFSCMDRYAIISVSDKSEIVSFSEGLVSHGLRIVSTSSTHTHLLSYSIPSLRVSELVHFPEILSGRVKTLNPIIFGGILADASIDEHMQQLHQNKIPLIDIVVVDLYPFVKNHDSKKRASMEEMIELIDIGGVSLLRAAAKNFKRVVPVFDKQDYAIVLEELQRYGEVLLDTRRQLASRTFQYISEYDQSICRFLSSYEKDEQNTKKTVSQHVSLPSSLSIQLNKVQDLKYGENPHQKAALYTTNTDNRSSGLSNFEVLSNNPMSFNNCLDVSCAWNIVSSVCSVKNLPCACTIVKHNNPIGMAITESPIESFNFSLFADQKSAFGGIIAFDCCVDTCVSQEIIKCFFECVIADDFTEDALQILSKKPKMRLLKHRVSSSSQESVFNNLVSVRNIGHDYLLQEKNCTDALDMDYKVSSMISPSDVVSGIMPTEKQLLSLKFAWNLTKYVKSNAIVLIDGLHIVGIGAGQMSRIDSVKIAIERMKNSKFYPSVLQSDALVMASDGFFPFDDAVDMACKEGVRSIIAPSGSIRDKDSITKAIEHKIPLVFMKNRHFTH